MGPPAAACPSVRRLGTFAQEVKVLRGTSMIRAASAIVYSGS